MENRIKRLITIIRYSFLLLLILFTTIIVIDAHVKNSAEDRIISADESVSLNADCIIVLGAGVRADGTPSPMLQDRLLQGIALYNMGVSDRLLMSGDNTKKGYDEVNTMKQYAIDKGIASEYILWTMPAYQLMTVYIGQRKFFRLKKLL